MTKTLLVVFLLAFASVGSAFGQTMKLCSVSESKDYSGKIAIGPIELEKGYSKSVISVDGVAVGFFLPNTMVIVNGDPSTVEQLRQLTGNVRLKLKVNRDLCSKKKLPPALWNIEATSKK